MQNCLLAKLISQTPKLTRSFSVFLVVLSTSLFLASASSARAEDISLSLRVSATDDLVEIIVVNTGKDSAKDVGVKLELDGSIYREELAAELYPGGAARTLFQVRLPEHPGTYPLYSTVTYVNEGQRLSLVDVGRFNYQLEASLEAEVGLSSVRIREHGELKVRYNTERRLRLVLPEEISVLDYAEETDGRRFKLHNGAPKFNLQSPFFAVLEELSPEGIYRSSITKGRIQTERVTKAVYLFPSLSYAIIALSSFIAAFYLFHATQTLTPKRVAALRWLFSISLVSLLYTFYTSAHHLADLLIPLLEPKFQGAPSLERLWIVPSAILETLYFEGNNYERFTQYLAQPLYLYIVFGNFFVLYYLVKPNPETDKYWHLMRAAFSAVPHLLHPPRPAAPKEGFYWNSYAKLAVLALTVKAFYLPLLTSWTIGNIFYQTELTQEFLLLGEEAFTFRQVHKYLMALLLLVDVGVFAFGYLTELPQLKNQIRSVEPTLFGWAVCIICYPPFNTVFELYTTPMNDNWAAVSPFWQNIAMLVVLLLWTVYAWATVALGWKASNLTNRGIISHGPYRYIRHPAYASKVALWGVECFFLNLRTAYLIFTFIVIYGLRAWTEERHLSADPDYLAYRKKVRRRFIPFVY